MDAELMSTEVAVIPKNEVVPVMERLLSAAQAGMNIDVLEKFLDLAERQEKREAEKAFHQAFSAFKADPPEIVKDKLVGFGNTKYKHATIGKVVSAIIGGMSKHGLSHRWNIAQDGNTITVTCKITHELGYSEETPISAGADMSGGKNSIQAIASTITYLERYSLQAATGIAVLEADDDGRGADDVPPPPKKGKKDQQKDEGTVPERKAVEGWLKFIDDHIKINGPSASKALEKGWEQNLKPFIDKFPKDQQNELTIAYKDTMMLLVEREAKGEQ